MTRPNPTTDFDIATTLGLATEALSSIVDMGGPSAPWTGEQDWCFVKAWMELERIRAEIKPASTVTPAAVPTPRRKRKPRSAPPDGWRTMAEAAAKLGCSIKTLKGHVASGALRYANIGHGKKRPTYRFTDADLDAFIASQTCKDVPCPSTASPARRSGTSISTGEVIAFTDRRRPRRTVKPKK